jgi:hypothetical protein
MSKQEILKNLTENLRSLADSLDALLVTDTDTEPAVAGASEEPTVTLAEVRAVLAEKSRDGCTAEVRGLLEKYGAAKLSEIDPAKYSALLADAEVLGDE